MSPIDDDTLDRLLGRHLSARLDGQLGKAEAAFRRRLARGDASEGNGAADVPHLRLVPAPDAPAPARRRTFGGWTLGWLAGVAGTAAAAGLAAVFLIGGPAGTNPPNGGDGRQQFAGSDTKPAGPGRSPDRGGGSGSGVVRPPAVRYVHNRTVDEGTVPDDLGRPVRRYRHQQVERLRWVDERGATVEMTIPREGVEQYELDTY